MIAKRMDYAPTHPRKWEAWGCSCKYTARDNGLWDSSPDDAGPHPDDVALHASEEDRYVLSLLGPEARQAVMHLLSPASPPQLVEGGR